MSKSKNNGVDPQSLIDTLGADTARLFVMFASPRADAGMVGFGRGRLEPLAPPVVHQLAQRAEARRPRQGPTCVARSTACLKQADYDYQRIQYNTVVSACMKMLNAIDDAKLPDGPHADAAAPRRWSCCALYPVVPHVTWHLWRDLATPRSWATCSTPLAARGRSRADRRRDRADAAGQRQAARLDPRRAQAAREDIEKLAAEQEEVARYLEGRPPKRVIVVPGKLVNVVG